MRRRERERLDAALYVGVGLHVHRERLRRNISQEELAAATGMTRTSITNLEAGRQRIPLHTLIHIARILSVNYLHLLPQRNPRLT